jgi:UDP-N-acetylmuramoyl-tripeptide--D-alanyl-D-alanine ligase
MTQTGDWKQSLHNFRRFLAKLWLKFNPQLTIVGITGSHGKTNTTRAITQVLSEKYQTLQTDLNLDTIYNLPITILKLRPWHKKLVLEMGVDHKNEMELHLWLVRPSIGVITGINPTHSDPELLGSFEGVIREKSKLLAALPRNGLAILNWDDENVRKMTKQTKAKVWRYGVDKKQCDFWADEIKVDFSGTLFEIGIKNYSSKKCIQVKTGLVGRHFVHSCLAAAAVGISQGLTLRQIKNGLAKLKPLAGRLSIEEGPKSSILINDCLRANPASTIAGLQTLVDLPTLRQAQGKRIAVLGEMGELGELAQQEHRRVGKEVARLKIDYLVSVGPLQKLTAEEAIKSGMKKDQVFWVEDVAQAARILEKLLGIRDLFYLKGSLLRHMERILLILNEKDVGCKVTSCHFYHQCPVCPYLHFGSPPDIM